MRGIEVRCVYGQPVHPQPGGVLLREVREFRREVDVEVIPAPDQRSGQAAVGSEDQVPVIGPGEALGLAFTTAVGAQLVEQVRPVPGPAADHSGDADPPAARAPHPHDGPGSARRPGAALRRPQPLARLILEADVGAQVARSAFVSGHTWSFHTATASSSRSSALRAIGVIAALEEDLRRPVLTANQVSLWYALRVAGAEVRVDDYGQLFKMSRK
jgi:hypothetical protein